ncbi:DNA adenine methylase [Mucilaginibacter sp. RS28]|uniref:site-specific DNA-methyltransferase (adenine-specific) n=1 Tax=Mucilaginibacter straminoryzae TaxID=2932774 RepID=A0A9X2BBD7_9SPHI|nr:DNA adenine methylase [Mucilaginibacter straminoryzae]MCJ8208068.1 DNA adenine methylase [Mucilaginibacter straminoryzae]
MDFYSPLRYPGGKGKISKFIKTIFEKNLLSDGVYVEPYAGGASVALSLVLDEYASKVIINDMDKSIYSFWVSVIEDSEGLCKLIRDTKVDMETWREAKEVQKNKDQVSPLELGFSTFFLNRTNRSGIIKAGVIGGNDQTGNWKIDARYNVQDLISRIQRIAKYADRIELHNSDACELIRTISNDLPPKSLLYFDPPYYVKGKDLYVNHYRHDDHAKVAEVITSITKQKWVVSYDNAPEIKELYKGFDKIEYSLNYSAAAASKGTEVMFFSDGLYVPPLNSANER